MSVVKSIKAAYRGAWKKKNKRDARKKAVAVVTVLAERETDSPVTGIDR